MKQDIFSNILFGGLSAYCFIKYIIIFVRMKKHTKIKGKVISTKKSYMGDSLGDGAHNKYCFEYEGNTIDIKDKFWGGNPKLKIGDEVYCFISKENKKVYVSPEDIYFKKFYLLGAIVFIISLFLI